MAQVKKATTVAMGLEVKSLKDAGYQGAVSSERMEVIARYVLDQFPSFAEEQPTEAIDGLKAGWMLRWQELNPAQGYNSEWIPVEKDASSVVTIDYAFAFSQQEFGRLKKDHPVQHGVVKGVRDKFNAYASNRKADLIRAVKALINKDKPRERVQAKDFSEYLADTFDTIKARRKTAEARGDTTVCDAVKLAIAIERFNDALK